MIGKVLDFLDDRLPEWAFGHVVSLAVALLWLGLTVVCQVDPLVSGSAAVWGLTLSLFRNDP
jgi:hypothetical protein